MWQIFAMYLNFINCIVIMWFHPSSWKIIRTHLHHILCRIDYAKAKKCISSCYFFFFLLFSLMYWLLMLAFHVEKHKECSLLSKIFNTFYLHGFQCISLTTDFLIFLKSFTYSLHVSKLNNVVAIDVGSFQCLTNSCPKQVFCGRRE